MKSREILKVLNVHLNFWYFFFSQELDEYFHGEESSINKYLIVLMPLKNLVIKQTTIGNYRAVYLPSGSKG